MSSRRDGSRALGQVIESLIIAREIAEGVVSNVSTAIVG